MNSLNIVSRLTTTPPPSPPRSRAGSISHSTTFANSDEASDVMAEKAQVGATATATFEEDRDDIDEKTPLLDNSSSNNDAQRSPSPRDSQWRLPKRITEAVFYGVHGIYRTITAPFRFVLACFYDDQGAFSAFLPLKNLRDLMFRRNRRKAHGLRTTSAADEQAMEGQQEKGRLRIPARKSTRRSPSVDSTTSSATAGSSDGEEASDSPARHTRSRTAAEQQQQQEEVESDQQQQPKKSIRIKVANEDTLRRRKASKSSNSSGHSKNISTSASADDVAVVASALKSPSSPASTALKLTRYPPAPAAPRPLIPRRQPSYSPAYTSPLPKKTLIIDLDETLIHSMAKGGRMSTGHMVEVRLGAPVSSSSGSGAGGVQLSPGVPILYYVHERPGCHEFLRKVCKWFQLIVFTASVQEYADPVIDWLEREKKYFAARYYRQHCTFRNGAYIKDLAQVEPDLSKVMILDNSPMSYIFHEDNAIPIEGWISDPTDNDLLHLIPFFEGLQYVTDVRALLALRQGQAQQA